MSEHNPRHPVLVASNRGPVSFAFADDGSLTSAAGRRRDGLRACRPRSRNAKQTRRKRRDALWICAAMSDADRAAARQGIVAAGESPGDVPVLMLDIPLATFEAAYNGIANSVLWFIHHMLYDTPNQPHFGAQFRARVGRLRRVQRGVRHRAGRAGRPGSRILIQDYHLALAPRQCGTGGRRRRIAHFSHTPWAPPAYFRHAA